MTERLVWDWINRERVPESVWEARRDAWSAEWDKKYGDRLSNRPMVISDSLGHGVQGLWHPAEGQRTDSKSEFRKWTRAHGCVEVGNETPDIGKRETLSKADRVAEIKKAMGAL